MHKSNEDCFYFLTSSCAKGAACTYRHCPLALTANVLCPTWQRGNCLDPACPFRHTNTIQRPMGSSGIFCFYENTPTGCLKMDCTFLHSRPRLHLKAGPLVRTSATNLINKDVVKPAVTNPPATTTTTTSSSSPNTLTKETPTPTSEPSTVEVKSEIVPRRVAVSSDNEQSNEGMKNVTRSVIQHSPEKQSDEKTNNSSRLVVNRNVVLAESPSRTIVQTTSSNRVVLSSTTTDSSPAKLKRANGNVEHFTEQENDSKKFKSDSPSTTDSSSTSTRLLRLATKDSTSTNDNKAIQSNRDRLCGNSSTSVSTLATETKTSTGTGLLSQDDLRRTNRLQRFKAKSSSPSPSVPINPPVSKTDSSINNSLTIRSVITLSLQEGKRSASQSNIRETPPAKRISLSNSSQEKNHVQQSKSSTSQTSSSTKTNDKQRRQEPSAKTTPVPNVSSNVKKADRPESPTKSPTRPRFTPQPIRPPSPVSLTKNKSQQVAKPPSVMIKRPGALITSTSSTSQRTETKEKNLSTTQTNGTISTSNNTREENELLKLNESSDVVDTFALIDEALLEADHLLELI